MQKLLIFFITTVLFLPYIQAQNVGIGTPSPDYTLDVNGQLSINDYIYHNDDLGGDTYTGFSAENTWEVIAGDKKIVTANGTSGKFVVNQNKEDVEFMVVGDGIDHLLYVDPSTNNVGIGTGLPNYLMDVKGDLRVVGDGIDHLLYIDSNNDNIGIGNSAPEYLFDVDGDLRVVGDGIDHLLYIDSNNDNIGIGNSTPEYLFDIDGDLRVVGDGIDHLLYIDSNNDNIGIGNSTPEYLFDIDGDLRVVGDGIDHLLYVESDNNRIGLGQATPLYLLDVKGDMRVVGDGIDHLFYVDTDSNEVGIGTSNPAKTLDVNGVTRTKGLEMISPYTGAVTTFEQISTGNETVTGGNLAGGVLTYNLQFPTFYVTAPKIVATVKGTDNGPEADATFVVSVRTANSSGVTLNIIRIDGGTPNGSWTQNLVISWMAWE